MCFLSARRLSGLLLIPVLGLGLGCTSGPGPRPDHSGARTPSSYDAQQELDGPRRQVVTAAHSMLGKPYRYGGTKPSRGFDCSGLVYYTHGKAGVSVPRTSGAQLEAARPTSLSRLRPGDLVFFEIGSKPSHVGIYVGGGEFIHAPSSGKRVTKTRLSDSYWRSRVVGAGHYY
jgi:cell wall-associated NlpC family hydrolase